MLSIEINLDDQQKALVLDAAAGLAGSAAAILAHKSRSVPANLSSKAGFALSGALATAALRSTDPKRAGAAAAAAAAA
eukprot:CAMPEP_0119284044 /NCGR_PEP_ID=MMETSP1329-20130426/29659_1 /TAXON_ID=114041 /ORGANISM="Genus nov. species nov., Strain RCC1024" /LENGTH=77 /DNA_ID=CAMNT_0007284719 /DNA_START=51 /DNA_END=281 /DNA_ORIENTATION=-